MSEKTLAQPARASQTRSALMPLLHRLHFYIGLFIGPFIFIAALTGTLYVLTPQLENALYAHQLFTKPASGPAKPLADQIRVAEEFIGHRVKISAVRPAPQPGETTRVMFTTPHSGPSETTAVFIDPNTLEIRGMLDVYGTSGVLPFRTWLDYLHRNLLLGDLGRNYSELAASWLWVAALGGVLMWATSRSPRAVKGNKKSRGQQILRNRYWHTTLGLVLVLGLLFFSATGLTWSRWAGDNISAMRAHFGWLTPSVNTVLSPQQPAERESMPGMEMPADKHAGHSMPAMKMPADEHAEHMMAGMPENNPAVRILPAQFDGVVKAARAAGINAGKIEIRPAWRADKAWIVSEIDRSWPTQVDSVAVDPNSFRVVDKVEFAQFGLLAKLTRWGVDAHMGVLFGLPNQLLLAFFGLGLCVMIVMGYRLWWLRRPAAGQGAHPAETLWYCWRKLSISARFLLLVCTVTLALSLPVMGVSLLVLLVIDALRWQRATKVAQA
ncbi:PepSY domain-containing protein [Pantoea sp. BAV 3049]|uniref:PepSY-associated TM helix domain-containing protein n=1 Tax=Pantoea sp. BAV 3049 TaxID=2654188 RepID=UPI00131C0416|nr:PepSY domain-containing protein [Pantoea sp. BAV 3049]